MNIKRIAAATTGALLLGVSLAGAVAVDDVSNFPFYSGSEPNVKIVVGSTAQPSDAVAAANIAAMIGNLAYASEQITVLGADALSCDGGDGDVSDLSGTFDVTTPGVNPNVAYQMKTYIGGYLDADSIDDRADDASGSSYVLMDASGNSHARKTTNYEAPALVEKVTVSDTSASKSYLSEGTYYTYAQTQYDATAKKVQAKSSSIGYDLRFTNPIPVCNDLTPSPASCSDSYKTELHRLKIKFLGSDWTVYELRNFLANGDVTSGSTYVKLSKEVSFKEFMQIGDEATAANGYKIKLDDIAGFAQGTGSTVPASFIIYDADGNEVDRAKLAAGETYDKNGVVINVLSVFTGSGGSAYAKVSIGSQTMTLTDDSTVQVGSTSTQENSGWTVNLVGGGASYGASLSRIQLKNLVPVAAAMNPGDQVYFIKNPKLMALTYNGLEDLTLDTVGLSGGTQRPFPTTGTDTATKAQYAYVSSTLTSPFNFGTASKAAFYVAVGSAEGKASPGVVFYEDTSGGGSFLPYLSTTSGYQARGNVTYSTSATVAWSGASNSTSYVQFWNNTGAGIQCSAAIANGSNLTSFTGAPSGGSLTWAFTGGFPTTSGYTLNGFTNSSNPFNATFTALGTSSTSATCTSGTATVSFTSGYGTLTPGVGATGATYSNVTNFVPYNYGTQTVYIKLLSDAIDSATTGPASQSGNFNGYFLQIPEYTDSSESTASMGAWLFDVSTNSGSSPLFASTSGTAYLAYNGTVNTYYVTGTAPIVGNLTGTAQESGYISNRGSTATISSSSASLSYATRLRYALYTLSGADTNATGNTAEVSAGEGENVLDSGGYKVVVKDLSGSADGSGAVSGVDGLVPSLDQAYEVKKLDTSSSPLVVLDSEASDTENLIVVGGPMVNSVAASVLGGTAINPGDSMVKVVGNAVVVAGYTAQDTQDAANELIAWLSANADSLSR